MPNDSPQRRILEGIVTTLDPDGGVHVSPMGPMVDDAMRQIVLRPFQTSTTFQNLVRTRQGVLHVTDDAELLARAAIGKVVPTQLSLKNATEVQGKVLSEACRWYEFRIIEVDDSQPRAELLADVVARGHQRDFFGFNRAKHAVVEAAILATRVEFLPRDEILADMSRLAVLIDKTAGQSERRAFDLLDTYIRDALSLHREARRVVEVTAPSRLHFGMLSFGREEVRQFGGVGVMIKRPGLRLRLTTSDETTASGPLADRAAAFLQRVASQVDQHRISGCRVEVLSAPDEHVGLGAGTQLGLAVAAGYLRLIDQPLGNAESLANLAGRAKRSAVGTHGFLHGGLIVEAGQKHAGRLSPLVAQLALPDAWRFVLIGPAKGGETAAGLSGRDEAAAFSSLPPVSDETTDRLCREAMLHLVPAAQEGDFDEFSASLYRYGRRAGECFASVQGGPFANEPVARLVATLRSMGIRGVGQSSWGPTVFTLLPDEPSAEAFVTQFRTRDEAESRSLTITPADNQGASIEVSTLGQRPA